MPRGAAVPKAAVEIANPAIGFHTSTAANERGEYSFQQLTPGNYTITVTSAGFGQTVLHANAAGRTAAMANTVRSSGFLSFGLARSKPEYIALWRTLDPGPTDP